MNLAAASGEDLATLHSNLVLFKCSQTVCKAFRNNFTFQSGSIQMDSESFEKILNAVFTFQSGSIQI